MAADSSTYTPETIARRYKIADELLASRKKPIQHWAEGLDELAKGYFGGKMYGDAMRDEKAGDQARSDALIRLLGGGAPMGGETPPPVPQGPSMSDAAPIGGANSQMAMLPPNPVGNNYGDVIASIESGGKYDRLGPVTKTGDRAYGKYQVMGNNIPQWSQAALGKQVTPQEFLSNPQLQDQIFQHRFGDYVSKYGPEGAAKAWFAGEKGMNNPNAKDQLGTSVSSYGSRFMKALGGGQQPSQGGQALAQALQPQQQTAQAGDMRGRLIQMLQDPNPAVRREAAKFAPSIMSQSMQGDKPTDEMREYELYRRQGGKDSFFDYKANLKKAGSTQVTVDQRGETEYDKTTGKQFAEMNAEIPKAAISARGKLATLDRLGSLLSDPNITTGAGAGTLLEMKRITKQMGIDVGDVGPAEAVRAIGNQFALELRNPSGGAGMPGALSDKDREFLQASVPGLMQNPEGNKLIVDYMKRVAQRSLDVERLRQQYVKQNKRLDEGFYSALADYSDKNPLFDEQEIAPQSAPPAASQAPAIQDGATATNPKTGETIIFKNGKWQSAI